mmetsp:Transcript_20488/g.30344  ORF Transcript_20488/g.30344 Transcript_20488/m.30344 type:complete len:174 (+) Transcript_20488:75-596(+)
MKGQTRQRRYGSEDSATKRLTTGTAPQDQLSRECVEVENSAAASAIDESGHTQQSGTLCDRMLLPEPSLSSPMNTERTDGASTSVAAAPLSPNAGEDDVVHPLFMDSLPSGFDTNPALSALASLLDGDVPKRCCGKVSRRPSRSTRRSHPYKVTAKNATTVSEAQLFMKMWKI